MDYIIYESFNEDLRMKREQLLNTRIIGVYKDEEVAITQLNKFVDSIIEDITDLWFVYECDVDEFNNSDIIKAYRVFKDEIENYNEYYTLILEKKESDTYGK